MGAELSYKETIKPIYQDANVFSEGYAAVKQNGKWGYIDENGKNITKFVYDYAGTFSEYKAIVGKIIDKIEVSVGGITKLTNVVKLSILAPDGKETTFMLENKEFVCYD